MPIVKFPVVTIIWIILVGELVASCSSAVPGPEGMAQLISEAGKLEYNRLNDFCPEAQLAFADSTLATHPAGATADEANYKRALALIKLGRENEAAATLEMLLKNINPYEAKDISVLRRELATAYLRDGEKTNCIHNHGAGSCIFPIDETGVHSDKSGSAKAAQVLEAMLLENPDDLEARWLLNIAYMTMGSYPAKVPISLLISGLGGSAGTPLVKPFEDMAATAGLNINNQAGGSIAEDFDNDGDIDLVTSSWDLKESMHYCRNNGDGTFTDVSSASGLRNVMGGSNIMQTDYNNDGFKDIFVLRGGWKGEYGKEPNSLLRNNGNGTFSDVTKEAGLLSFHPTQTATWNDFNNDGWLDVFIGNESTDLRYPGINACELYINNGKGAFTNTALESGANISAFVKGVASGDYDNDGWVDIIVSTMENRKYLLKNEGTRNGMPHFRDVASEAGLGNCNTRTFATWFWDYDNDGYLDIFLCNYNFTHSLGWYAAAEALHLPAEGAAKQFLFRNKHDGTFEDVSGEAGLGKVAFAMGANFGDIDNDGYPDMFLGTGNPDFQSLVPNKLFKNTGGKYFSDVTSAARVGSLQKGHGVSFCDLDSDGDEDIYIDMGGAYPADAYENSLFVNPGQNSNRSISIKLEGVQSNKAAIGAKIKVSFKEGSNSRSVYRDVNSGGSFGSNPLVQHIGIGQSKIVDTVEIRWPATKTVQRFANIQPGDYLVIKEGAASFQKKQMKKLDFSGHIKNAIDCVPVGPSTGTIGSTKKRE